MRILNFADGFTSSSAPTIIGGSSQENFSLNNSATNVTLTTFDSNVYKSVFFDYCIKRSDAFDSYVQNGSGILAYDGGAWNISFGNYQDDDLITSETPIEQKVRLYMTTSLGVGTLKYDTGTMGDPHFCNISFIFTRILL